MRTIYFVTGPMMLSTGCATTADAPINITNEITIADSCCECGDPCDDGESPCEEPEEEEPELDTADPTVEEEDVPDPIEEEEWDTGKDTSEPTDEPTPMVDVYERNYEFLDLEVSQVDVAFLLDTTSSMGATAESLADEFGEIVDDLAASITDGAYGFATFDDYNYTGMGADSDRPFILRQQMTTEQLLVQDALDAIEIHNGADTPESTIEALFQGLTGVGYDQTGDGVFDPATDVHPFLAGPDDAFAGAVMGTFDEAIPGTGVEGGYGFRDGSLPVIVYATDSVLRDADDSDYALPPEAGFTAGSSDVMASATDLGARLIGVATNEEPVDQMTILAEGTNSMYAAGGDGLIDDPLVFVWGGSSEEFRNTIVEAIEGMLGSVTFETVTAVVTGNTHGFDTDVEPASYSNVTVGAAPVSLNFAVEISGEVPASTIDQTFPMNLEIYGDGVTLLATRDVTVVVPASL